MYNTSNYGYNPYYQPQRFQQPMSPTQMSETPQYNQMFTKPITLQGKQVDSIDVVKGMDIPLDGSISYFPLADGTAIVSKQLRTDGTSKMIIYKPATEEQPATPTYITNVELDEQLSKLDLTTIKEDIEHIKQELDDLKKGD